jgi:hypothetical protein
MTGPGRDSTGLVRLIKAAGSIGLMSSVLEKVSQASVDEDISDVLFGIRYCTMTQQVQVVDVIIPEIINALQEEGAHHEVKALARAIHTEMKKEQRIIDACIKGGVPGD